MNITAEHQKIVAARVNRERLVDTAKKLIAVPSRTGEAGAVSDQLAEILKADGFTVTREIGNHPTAPAVLVRHESGVPGRCLQFNGHLDVVHLPYVPPSVEGNLLKGSGSCDMKGGVATAIEALRAVRDSGLLKKGGILLCAHDLHEAPWGLGEQLDTLIRAGIHGDAVLLPEPLTDHLPLAGRGSATWKVHVRRPGAPIHEVMRPDEPSVIAAGAELVQRLGKLGEAIKTQTDPVAGTASVFVGQIHSGEIFNQYPQECMLEGTRRWLNVEERADVKASFHGLLADLAKDRGVTVDCEWKHIRDPFRLDLTHPIVAAFQQSYTNMNGKPLKTGPKQFVDDGNAFFGLANLPAITHGPRAGGQHTVNEWIDIDDMVRVATLYAMTALAYLND
ncbi:MAG: M20 family metallopeptidase [Planctomycetes bacterium]|nr:M20 family metallopeptidase [Planctomycetota bacterium]